MMKDHVSGHGTTLRVWQSRPYNGAASWKEKKDVWDRWCTYFVFVSYEKFGCDFWTASSRRQDYMPSFWLVFLSSWKFHNGTYCVGPDESYKAACDKIEWSIRSPKETCNLCQVRAKTSIYGSCSRHPWRWRWGWQTSCTSFETFRPPETAQRQKRKGPPVWKDPTAILEQQVSRTRANEKKDASILGKKSEGEALRNIVNKLSDERNLKD